VYLTKNLLTKKKSIYSITVTGNILGGQLQIVNIAGVIQFNEI